MARKRYSDEDVLKLLREIDVHLHDGLDVVNACRKAGISDNKDLCVTTGFPELSGACMVFAVFRGCFHGPIFA